MSICLLFVCSVIIQLPRGQQTRKASSSSAMFPTHSGPLGSVYLTYLGMVMTAKTCVSPVNTSTQRGPNTHHPPAATTAGHECVLQ
ncbi:hypothetical protein F4780DRAFT_753711 [Xylariomycetidae sp. FL0641]|nr:hypothetical protein F4780DRAFT_753711 [Xylariomycetidae sp. FL0641]